MHVHQRSRSHENIVWWSSQHSTKTAGNWKTANIRRPAAVRTASLHIIPHLCLAWNHFSKQHWWLPSTRGNLEDSIKDDAFYLIHSLLNRNKYLRFIILHSQMCGRWHLRHRWLSECKLKLVISRNICLKERGSLCSHIFANSLLFVCTSLQIGVFTV